MRTQLTECLITQCCGIHVQFGLEVGSSILGLSGSRLLSPLVDSRNFCGWLLGKHALCPSRCDDTEDGVAIGCRDFRGALFGERTTCQRGREALEDVVGELISVQGVADAVGDVVSLERPQGAINDDLFVEILRQSFRGWLFGGRVSCQSPREDTEHVIGESVCVESVHSNLPKAERRSS
jgi:hypothetical protein